MTIYSILLIIHVIFGFSALITGAFAMLLNKNVKKHKIFGKIYYWSMIGVFVTVVPMFIIKGNALLFLFLVGIFSTYLAVAGRRYLTLNNRAKNLRWSDYIVVGFVFITAVSMITLGIYDLSISRTGTGLIVLVFGSILLSNTIQDIRFLKKVYQGMKGLRKPLYNHISRMGGAYIATFTAFMVNNFSMVLPFYITWFLPAVIGATLISLTIKRLKNKRKSTPKGVLISE